MGRRGPPPKPTAVKLVEGNPGSRPINRREPKPRKTTPRCPAWLSKQAKAVWRETVPELERLGVLTVVDGKTLATYCVAYARWQEAEMFLQTHGSTYAIRDDSGRVKYMAQFPQVSVARSLLHQLRQLAAEFGLSPASRTRLEVTNPGEFDDDDEFMMRRWRMRRRGQA